MCLPLAVVAFADPQEPPWGIDGVLGLAVGADPYHRLCAGFLIPIPELEINGTPAPRTLKREQNRLAHDRLRE